MYPVVFDPPAFQLFGVTIDLPAIYSFGVMMATAFMVAAYLTGLELERKGYDREAASSLMLWAALGGIGGARLLSLLEDWDRFVASPLTTILSGSGFTWYGGLIGGLVAVSYGMRLNRLPWGPTADAIAPGLCLAHAIGRIGCQLAGDGDWGSETTVPWGMAYPNAIVGWPYPPGVVVHPTPLYEFAAYSAIAAYLWTIRAKPHRPGSIFWTYLLLSSPARFVIEIFRVNPRLIAGLSEAQLLSIALCAIGGALLWRNERFTQVRPS